MFSSSNLKIVFNALRVKFSISFDPFKWMYKFCNTTGINSRILFLLK